MNIDHYRSRLRIDKHALDDELETNAQTLDEIGREVVKRNTKTIEAKKDLELIEGQVIRRLKDADPKMTNPNAERECKREREWVAVWSAYQALRAELEEWESLYKAWVSRGYDLKGMGELYANQYFVVDSLHARRQPDQADRRSAMRERVGEQRKEATSRRTNVD